MKELKARTVVVGSGCAGLNAADCLCALGEEDVLLVTEDMRAGTSRNTGSDKQTYYRLSLAGDEGDSVGSLARTLKRDDVDGDIALCEAAGSARCFFKLVQLGVPFPCNELGEYVGYRTDHDVRARASSAGPLTSRYMTEALEASVLRRGVPILDHTLAYRILVDDGGVCGLQCLDMKAVQWVSVRCAHVVLATGGPAAIYLNRVYPESQLGMSGMAFEAGAAGATCIAGSTAWPPRSSAGTFRAAISRPCPATCRSMRTAASANSFWKASRPPKCCAASSSRGMSGPMTPAS